jgi:hypothetical protein
MAASWYEAQQEAMFKRVQGGVIFRAPGLFPRHYLVTEAQKAEIHSLMRTPVRPTLKRIFLSILAVIGFLVLVILPVTLLAIALQLLWERASGSNQSDSWTLISPLLFLSCYMYIIPRLAVMARSGQIGRVLEGARQTEQRITLRDRSKAYARLVPLSTLLAAGVACALSCALFAIFAFGVPSVPQHQMVAWFFLVPFALLALLALLAVRCFYVAILKRSLGRSA